MLSFFWHVYVTCGVTLMCEERSPEIRKKRKTEHIDEKYSQVVGSYIRINRSGVYQLGVDFLAYFWAPLPSECLTARIWGQERITWEWFLHIWILNFNSTYFPPCQISRSKLLTETCVKFFNVLQKIEASKISSQKKVRPELGPPARASSARGLTVRMRWQARAELVWTHLSTRLAEPFPTMGVVRRISKNFAR